MAGKITFRNCGADRYDGGWVEPVAMSQGDWKGIEDIVGKLSTAARKQFVDLCAHYRLLAELKEPSTADVRATLAAIAKGNMEEHELQRAMKDCDETTHALLQAALYEIDGPNFSEQNLLPAKVRVAAWLALDGLGKSKGGAPKKWWRRLLARRVLQYCAKHELSTAISSNDGNSTAPVRLLMALLWIVNPDKPPEDGSVAVKLLLEARDQVSA